MRLNSKEALKNYETLPAIIPDTKEFKNRIRKCKRYIRYYGIEIEDRELNIVRFFFPRDEDFQAAKEELYFDYPELFL